MLCRGKKRMNAPILFYCAIYLSVRAPLRSCSVLAATLLSPPTQGCVQLVGRTSTNATSVEQSITMRETLSCATPVVSASMPGLISRWRQDLALQLTLLKQKMTRERLVLTSSVCVYHSHSMLFCCRLFQTSTSC